MHKPTVPEEVTRVEASGGEMRCMRNKMGEDIGPLRVYKKGFDYPGICMTRSIGDFAAREVGLVSEPTIDHYTYNPEADEVLIIGSDGLWDAIEGLDAVNFVQKYRNSCLRNDTSFDLKD